MGGGDRVGDARERDEERIALRVHLDATALGHRCAQCTPVVSEHLDVTIAELVQQPGRAFDVSEEQRDSPGRQPHPSSIDALAKVTDSDLEQ